MKLQRGCKQQNAEKFSQHKKGQIQIFETISVIFVFFILMAIGFIFYGKVIKGNIANDAEEISQLRSISIAQRAMFMPELQCSEDNVVKENCIDLLKLEASSFVIDPNNPYYFDILGFSELNVTEIYPDYSWHTVYSRKIPDYKTKFVTNIPISLYDASTRQYDFGVLTIETMSK